MSNYLFRLADDARFDAMIEDRTLRELGVIEPDQPTAYSHWAWMEQWRKKMQGDFTPEERQKIRTLLGLAEDSP